MKIRTKTAAMTLAAAGVLGSVMMASPAYAGTNGQQINLCGVPAGEIATVSGTNQNGAAQTTSTVIWPDVCVDTLPGYWWVGYVAIAWYTPSNTYQGTTYCYIPQNQGKNNDWVDCYA